MVQNTVNTDNILSVLDDYISSHNSDDIALGIARDFRKRRVEKGLTREQLAEKAKISVSNVTRFEQKGLTESASILPQAEVSCAFLCQILSWTIATFSL